MDTIEVVDELALPIVEDDYMPARVIRYARPLATEADLIAACAPIGEVEVRYMVDIVPDDPAHEKHAQHACAICSEPPAEYVQPEKHRDRDIYGALAEFGVEWDPDLKF